MIIGALKKMPTQWANPVGYYLSLGQEQVLLNQFLRKKIYLKYLGKILCIQCGRETKKSFQQGFCFPCYRRLLECNLCGILPEKCRCYEVGICKPDDWAHAHCLQAHVVYLANSSGLKVGITRESHVPSRWIDQGATQGLVICKVKNRYQAGRLEVVIKQHLADKTNWQAMLKSNNQELALELLRDEVLAKITVELKQFMQEFPGEIAWVTQAETVSISYPVEEFPQKIKTFDFEKTPLVEGILQGIKAQYLLLDTGVISIRKFAGYLVQFDVYSE